MEPDGDQQGQTPGVRLWPRGHGSVSGSSWLGVRQQGTG